MSQPAKLFFLPGALGRTDFWRPVSTALKCPAQRCHVEWPGFSGVPPDASIQSIHDLAARVAADIHEPTALIAQSMGGVVAILAALQKPDLITHLVLTVTSGGMDLATLGAEDWRPSVQRMYPTLPDWFLRHTDDLTHRLPEIRVPSLLLWGDADPISPVAVGERLASLLPRAELHVFKGADHDLASTHAAVAASLIDRHLELT